MPEKISIVKESGETINSNIVSVFMIPETAKKYIITTENAVDPHGLTVLHVSEIVDGTLQKVATDDEWTTIKTIMRAIISGNVVSYKYLPPIESLKASGQYSRDISVSASASKQMVDNYNAADKSDTATSTEASPEPVAPAEPAAPEIPAEPEASSEPVAPAPEPTIAPLPQPNSIFPSNNQPQGGDELIPGISEVSEVAPASPPVSPVVDINQPVPLMDNIPVPPVVGTQEISIDPNTGLPIMQQAIPPVPVNDPMLNTNIPLVNENPMMNNMLPPEIPGIEPAQVIPTGQIIQDATTPGMNVPLNPNIIPSFNPNATLDEVVIASQEMFMEGVKNLVQTIQEKVYRELYAKEAELKAREEALIQREQLMMMSNQQMMNFNQPMPNQVPQMGQNPTLMLNQNMAVKQQPMNQMMQQPMQMQPNMMQQHMNQMMQPMQQPMPPQQNMILPASQIIPNNDAF